MKSIFLAAALFASISGASMAAPIVTKPLAKVPAADAQPDPEMTDEDVRSQLAANLGAIDTVIPATRWKALGLRAEAPLLEILNSPDSLPTRRAKAIDGLSTIGTSRTELLRTIAGNEQEPYVVRDAAVRGLGNLLSENEMIGQLTPLLTAAKDARVRATAGFVMARHAPATCPAVKAQIRREESETRGHFARAMDVCFGQ